jgi:hypothetical protein
VHGASNPRVKAEACEQTPCSLFPADTQRCQGPPETGPTGSEHKHVSEIAQTRLPVGSHDLAPRGPLPNAPSFPPAPSIPVSRPSPGTGSFRDDRSVQGHSRHAMTLQVWQIGHTSGPEFTHSPDLHRCVPKFWSPGGGLPRSILGIVPSFSPALSTSSLGQYRSKTGIGILVLPLVGEPEALDIIPVRRVTRYDRSQQGGSWHTDGPGYAWGVVAPPPLHSPEG